MKVDLQTSEAEQPVPRKTPSVNKLCDIVSILDVPFQALPNWTNDKGEPFKKLSYDVEMVPSGATLEFNVYIDGKRQKSKDTNVTF